MRKIFFIFFIFTFSISRSQTCPDGMVYIHSNPLKVFDPSQPFVLGTNPSTLASVNTMTAAMGGLGYGPNANTASPPLVFYTTIIGIYHYWNGSSWVSTNHSTTIGNTGNLAVGPGCIYNFNVSTGGVYLYNGSSNATFLFTVPGWFSSAGVADIAVDNCCNIYVMKSFAPQSLSVYSPAGVLLSSCSISGMPSNTGGGGLAITGNYIVTTSASGAVYVGAISGSSATFTNVASNFGGGGGDLASCPIACNGPCSVVLPIDFVSFNCQKYNNSNKLTWKTASETGILNFEVERSFDGLNFVTVGSVVAKNLAGTYDFVDETAVSNEIYYYKITAVEKTGERKSTSMCSMHGNTEKISSSNFFPNPCSQQFYIDLNANRETSLEIYIFNMLGIKIKHIYHHTEMGFQTITFDISDLPAGTYCIQEVFDGISRTPQRLFKID